MDSVARREAPASYVTNVWIHAVVDSELAGHDQMYIPVTASQFPAN